MTQDSAFSDDLWVFAYGSLMWRPGFDYATRERARMEGYHRCFCMSSIHYRGTPEAPGLVLALDPEAGAVCEGIAYRVLPESRDIVLSYLRERELISSAYREVFAPMVLSSGHRVEAVTYVMDQAHEQYCGRLTLDEQAEIIARSHGKMGPNADYLFETAAHLQEIGCPDPDLSALDAMVRLLRP